MQNLYRWLKTRRFEIIVFITGAAVLIIEITATRILSPYYGNTIYAVSSIIGVILGALSLGYWQGGIQADQKPAAEEFYKVIFQSGMSLFFLFMLVIGILPAGSRYFSVMSGPLVWSLVLFLPPNYLLGKCSPFAIVLAKAAQPDKGLGHITGSIFFWSTMGSIAGSLVSGFLLIPHFGVRTILCATAGAILLLGGTGYVLSSAPKTEKRDTLALLVLLLGSLVTIFAQGDPLGAYLYKKDGIYQKLRVLDSHDMTAKRNPTRVFFQDSNFSSGVYLNNDNLLFGYTKYYELYRLASAQPKRALVIGAGAYSIPKAIHADSPETQIDVVDIEPELEQIAYDYFRLQKTPKIVTYVADGRRFLYDTTEPYDFIFSDVYSSLFSIPSHFTTREFFTLAKSKLAPGGIFMANIIGSTEPMEYSFLFSEIRTMHEVFPDMAVIAVQSATQQGPQNFIFVGAQDDKPLDAATIAAKMPQEGVYATLPAHLLNLANLPLKDHALLTDDYAPVEKLTANFLHDQHARP